MYSKRKFSIHIVLAFCLGIFPYITAHANALTSKTAPVDLIKAELKLVGKAQFSVLFWDIYASRLYTLSGKYEGVKPSVLFEITYQKDITRKDLVERTIEQWQHLGVKESDYQRFVLPLRTLWPDITKGDKLALQVGVNKSVFYMNDKYLGQIEDKWFAGLFLDIWLSPKTSQPKLRLHLLGDKKDDKK
jgi:hypothetical protein